MYKYSIILPYHNRYLQTRIAFQSFRYWYSDRSDYEIILVEDEKNRDDVIIHSDYNKLLTEFNDLPIKSIQGDGFFNPAAKFNLGVKESSGEYIILSNPEIIHDCDLLGRVSPKKNIYYVCSCESIFCNVKDIYPINYTHLGWYQHSIHHNYLLHFCSIISRENYGKIGGFDEEYCKGIAYEDNDFINKIRANLIEIETLDIIYTLHIWHETSYQTNKELWKINENYYNNKWGL